jgi:hypothetical protein
MGKSEKRSDDLQNKFTGDSEDRRVAKHIKRKRA